ncbi:hypothetical protein K2173_020563 [Erythroxylum novogranatense]|uniref:ENTH domain-containing protein n=1 Tax=Erythroxylum novogranatense TaxID=1862640 RepID=A0AAV8TGS0_9ROSI|nr:hypothetical protein K2173_020563 [Erythroxylum novogranatense]
MSMLLNSSSNMGSPFFHDLKRQASFFLKEKIKSARLAFTDVTPVELLAEEGTNGDIWPPDTRNMRIISRAAFEVDDYWRVVDVLHRRLIKFDRPSWRTSYKTLLLLEQLLCHGPLRVAEEFQSDKDAIKSLGNFQFVDEKGFNWGSSFQNQSEKILRLLEDGQFLEEERTKARKLTRGIQGFGSFSQRPSSNDPTFIRTLPSINNKTSPELTYDLAEASDEKRAISGQDDLMEDHPFSGFDRGTTTPFLSTAP